MFIAIITDCFDGNASARQQTRWASFFDTHPTLVGVDNYNEYEASAHLIDVLDASAGKKGIVFAPGKNLKTKLGEFTCYERLKDVPNGQPALIIGSWGIRDQRFVALVVQGKSAQKEFGLKPGTPLFY